MSVTRVMARIPVSKPTRMSTRVLNQRDYVIVAIETDDSDQIGIGYSYAGTSGGQRNRIHHEAHTTSSLTPI